MNQFSQSLIDNYGLSEDHLAEAQRIKAEKGGNIGQILVDQNHLSETQLLEALKNQYDLPFWPKLPFDHTGIDFTANVPIQFLKKYVIVPFECRKPITAADCGLAPAAKPESNKELYPPGFG